MRHLIPFLILISMSTMESNAQTAGLTSSLNKYSFDLYREIKKQNDNLFISPVSTYVALLIAYEGAGFATKNEFNKVLNIDKTDSLAGLKSFIADLTNFKNSSNYINMANAIWIQDQFKIEKNYLDRVNGIYLAEIKGIDFLKKLTALSVINQWVSDKTNGKIKEIVKANDINENTRLIISNAIYFIGKWADEFDKNLTKADDFYSILKNRTPIDFMNKTESLKYFENQDFQFVAIPYEGDDKSFCIILPKERYGIDHIESSINNKLLDSVLDQSKRLSVNLSIPKFKLETSYSLIEPLKRLGLKAAFTSQADFSGISRDGQLMINAVNHKAYIEIDEKKTEAAASTAIAMMTGAVRNLVQPRIFKADHPFIFMILDNTTKGILFMGKYVKPE